MEMNSTELVEMNSVMRIFIGIYVIACLQFEDLKSFHSHGNFFPELGQGRYLVVSLLFFWFTLGHLSRLRFR